MYLLGDMRSDPLAGPDAAAVRITLYVVPKSIVGFHLAKRIGRKLLLWKLDSRFAREERKLLGPDGCWRRDRDDDGCSQIGRQAGQLRLSFRDDGVTTQPV
jgi:hypothetical protein